MRVNIGLPIDPLQIPESFQRRDKGSVHRDHSINQPRPQAPWEIIGLVDVSFAALLLLDSSAFSMFADGARSESFFVDW